MSDTLLGLLIHELLSIGNIVICYFIETGSESVTEPFDVSHQENLRVFKGDLERGLGTGGDKGKGNGERKEEDSLVKKAVIQHF